MRSLLLQNCLAKSKTFKKVKDFFKDICNLDLCLLDADGRVVPQETHAGTQASNPSFPIWPGQAAGVSADKVFVAEDIMEECIRTKRSVHYLCSKGYRNFLVPIIKKESVVGFLTTGENKGVPLDKRQTESIVIFLQDILKKSMEEDLVLYKDFAGQAFSPQRRILNKVLKYITENYDSPSLTLKEAAAESGVSYFHLSHLFKKETQASFSDYLNNFRINVAVRLLKDKSLTVNQVSLLCGYEDPSYFGKVFKKVRGMTPAAFRNQDIVKASVVSENVSELVFQS